MPTHYSSPLIKLLTAEARRNCRIASAMLNISMQQFVAQAVDEKIKASGLDFRYFTFEQYDKLLDQRAKAIDTLKHALQHTPLEEEKEENGN